VGDYPVVLMVKDPNTPSNNKSYVYANGEVLTERVFIYKYFYLHDRLGSVRQLVNTSGNVVNTYTYDPWGNAFPSETSETVDNDIEFANYQWDDTVGMYYLNARWYDPVILRFTGRDPVRGGFREPLTLHAYLYCMNDPLNATDPTGEYTMGQVFTAVGTQALLGAAWGFGAGLGWEGMEYLAEGDTEINWWFVGASTMTGAIVGTATVIPMLAIPAWYGSPWIVPASRLPLVITGTAAKGAAMGGLGGWLYSKLAGREPFWRD